jgi:hypothetical protein
MPYPVTVTANRSDPQQRQNQIVSHDKTKGKKGSGVPEQDLFWDSSDEQEYAKEQDSSDCILESDQSEINLKPAAQKNNNNNGTKANISKRQFQ